MLYAALIVLAVLAAIFLHLIEKQQWAELLRKLFPNGYDKEGFLGFSKKFIIPFHDIQLSYWIDPGGKSRSACTHLDISVPETIDAYMRIRMKSPPFFGNAQKVKREEFLKYVMVQSRQSYLQELSREEAFVDSLYDLYLAVDGDCDIRFEKREINFVALGKVKEKDAVRRFVWNAMVLFQKYGQTLIVHHDWLASQVMFDFWAPDFASGVFGQAPRPVDDAPQRQPNRDRRPQQEFVLCSRCFGQFDDDTVRCETCGAGHHRRCAQGNCGECGQPMHVSEIYDSYPTATVTDEDRQLGEGSPRFLAGGAGVEDRSTVAPEPVVLSLPEHREEAPVAPHRRPVAIEIEPSASSQPRAGASDFTSALPQDFAEHAQMGGSPDFGASDFGEKPSDPAQREESFEEMLERLRKSV
jgi:hypothetical protein